MNAADYDRLAREQRRAGKEACDGALDMRELVRMATLAASSHNTQPWKFRTRERSITILPDFTRRCPVVDPDNAHLFKSLGCAAENLVHAANAQGHAAQVAFVADQPSIAVRLERSPAARAGELFRAIPFRQCTKTAYDGGRISAGDLKRLESSGTGEGVRLLVLQGRGQLDAVADFVAQGDRAQLADRDFRKELVSWIRFNHAAAVRRGDGLAGRTCGLPAIPTWIGRRLIDLVLTPKSQAASDARNIRSSGAVAIVVAQRDEPAAWVEAGRVYERFALQAAALGLRNAFVNQPIEVRPLRPQFETWLGLREERALLIVRLGRAPLSPFSLRRPVENVLVDQGV